MFSKTIVDSDAFLDMPLSTQALYFHLSMRADDDGFVNSPKKISKMIGASDDELKVLFAKRFILGFESGIIVIKHWRIHNYIQKDRYRETSYVEEKAMLLHKENAGYTLYTTCIQNGDSGKDRLELGKSKDSLEIEIEIDEAKDILSASPLETTIIEEVVNYLNAKTGAKYKATTPKTRTLIKARIKEGFTLNDFYTVIDKKVLMWSNKAEMQGYLRPETLFGSKFEGYLNEIVTPSSALVASGAISSQDARNLETAKRWADKKMGEHK